MATSAVIFLMVVANAYGATTSSSVIEKQNRVFGTFWGTDFVWKFDDLPTTGTVPNYRVPYSGYIYPDRGGGTSNALRKYDNAFHGGRMLAVGFEQWDTTAFKERTPRRGPFGIPLGMKMETPNWHGHCNGWAAATIRHAEPKNSVRRNGVTFTPADIKALLAEIYMYNDVDHLAGVDSRLDAGTFHAIITNWLGRGAHPLGMEADPSEEKWNYPIYAFSSSSAKRSDRRVEVKLNLAYIKDTTGGEYQEGPHIRRIKSFHYDLYLNTAGNIVGGNFYRDSAIIEMLWLPLRPKQGRQKGNESGNPHVNVEQVLAIWRESADPEQREKWLIVDPPKEDRVLNVADVKTLIPLQDPHAPRTAPSVATRPSPTLRGERSDRAATTAPGTSPATNSAAASQPAESESLLDTRAAPAADATVTTPEVPADKPSGETAATDPGEPATTPAAAATEPAASDTGTAPETTEAASEPATTPAADATEPTPGDTGTAPETTEAPSEPASEETEADSPEMAAEPAAEPATPAADEETSETAEDEVFDD